MREQGVHTKLAGEILGKWTFGIRRKRWDNSINMVVRKLHFED
jgi:hypothetical protein